MDHPFLRRARIAIVTLGATMAVLCPTVAAAAPTGNGSYAEQLHDFAQQSDHTRSSPSRDGRNTIAPAADCPSQGGSDPVDSDALDIGGYAGGMSCDSPIWVFAVSTYDDWSLAELDSFAVFMDLDGNASNGCDGWDGGIISYYDGALESATIHTPTCDQNTWSSGPAAAQSGTTTTIAVGTSDAELGSPGSVRWATGLSSIYGDYDRAPNSGTVTSPRASSSPSPSPGPSPSPSPSPGPTPAPSGSAGYVLLASNGGVYAYGAAHDVGNGNGLCAASSCASIAVRSGFDGYWIANSACNVGNFGAAPNVGSPNLGAPCALERTSSGGGFWAVTPQGTVAAQGDAVQYGSAPGGLNAPIVDVARIASGNGYWLLGKDGGIFTFGAARFFGSTGAMRLNQPVVGMTPTPSGNGYWLVASDGGIFTFGDAPFFGSTGAMRLNRPIIGMVATPSGHGYWLVAADGGIFTFGDAAFLGSPAGNNPAPSVVAFAGP